MLLELFFMKWKLLFICLTGLLLYYNYTRRKLYWAAWKMPGPNPALPFLGNFLFICRRIRGFSDIVPLLDVVIFDYAEKCGLVRIWLGTALMVLVTDPGVAYQVNQKTQLKSKEYQYFAKPYIANALFNSNDLPRWRQTKKAFLLALSSENLQSAVPIFHRECLKLRDTFSKYSAKKEGCYTGEIFQLSTLSCVVKCATDFDIHKKDEAENVDLLESLESLMKFFQLRLMIPILRNNFIYSLLGLRAKELKKIKTVFSYSKSILDSHKEKKLQDRIIRDVTKDTEEKFLIDYLLKEELNMTEHDILANIIVMIIGGTDTVATECTMLLLLLAQNPPVQKKVYDELTQVLGDDFNNCPSIKDLGKLEYLDRVLKECLRMFPAAPIIARCTAEDITVTGNDSKQYAVPQGATIGILIKSIQNNPFIYENPTKFDPDRWLPENVAKRPPWSYLPFNNGQRKCVGGRYALLHLKTMAATVLRAFEVLTSPSCETFEDIRVEMNFTVRIDPSCQVMFRPRSH